MRRCQVIVRYGVGFDNIDLDAARRRRIYVANIPDYGADEVSDHAVSLILAVLRRLNSRDRDIRNGRWGVGQREKIYPLRGRVLGLVGFGRVARLVHRKLSVFGIAETLIHDPYLDGSRIAEDGVVAVDLEALCRRIDIVSLHAPLTAANHHLIDAAKLSLMRPSAILVTQRSRARAR